MIKKISLILIGCILCINLYPGKEITEAEWERTAAKYDYTENYKEFKQRQKVPKEPISRSNRNKSRILASVFKIIPLLILAAVLIFLIIMLINNISRITTDRALSGNNQQVEIDDPDHYEKSDLERFLKDALESANYRLAIRVQFLMVIKLLQDRELIAWKKEKTNTDYLLELRQQEFKNAFKYLVKVFERIWYANYDIDRLFYESLSEKFEYLKMKIDK